MKIKNIVAAIPMTDVERAKTFYKQSMGFELETLSDNLQMYWVKKDAFKFLLYLRDVPNKAEHTAISFSVEDITDAIITLENKGVHFYESDGKNIFELDGNLSAWFQDTEGNNLEISQRKD